MSKAPIRAAIYARISVNRPEVPKVENQVRQCRQLADREGYEVVRVFSDDGISASSFKKRPQWESLLEGIKAGEFEVILATEEERFTRQVIEKELFQIACINGNASWHTLRDGKVDPETDTGEFFSSMRAAMGRMESKRKADRQRAANLAIVTDGMPIVRKRPFGFEADGVTIRESEAGAIRRVYARIIAGDSMWEVMQYFEREGITPVVSEAERARAKKECREPRSVPWSYGSLGALLKRERNRGKLVHQGQVVGDAPWMPLVSSEDFDIVQGILGRPERRVTQDRQPRWLLSGIALCATCGNVLRTSSFHGRGIYRCASATSVRPNTERHPSVYASMMDDVVLSDLAVSLLVGQRPEPVEAPRVREVQRQLARVGQAKAALVDLVGTPGFEGEFRRRARELAVEESDLKVQLSELAVQSARSTLRLTAREQFWARVNADSATSLDELPEKDSVRAELDELDIAVRRTLVAAELRVVLFTGTGPNRVSTAPLDDPEALREQAEAAGWEKVAPQP